MAANNIPGTLEGLAEKWKHFAFERPFEYFFLDDSFAKLYASESRFQKVFIGLVILGIFIACLGLLGLATYAAQQRVKEIGIRKTLGASVTNVVILLVQRFYQADNNRIIYRRSHCLVCYGAVVAGFRLPHRYRLVDIHTGQRHRDRNSFLVDQFSNDRGRAC